MSNDSIKSIADPEEDRLRYFFIGFVFQLLLQNRHHCARQPAIVERGEERRPFAAVQEMPAQEGDQALLHQHFRHGLRADAFSIRSKVCRSALLDDRSSTRGSRRWSNSPKAPP